MYNLPRYRAMVCGSYPILDALIGSNSVEGIFVSVIQVGNGAEKG